VGYYINEFWAGYSTYINRKALIYMKECENGNPSNELKKYKGPDTTIAKIYDLINLNQIDEAEKLLKTQEKIVQKGIRDYIKENKGVVAFNDKRAKAVGGINYAYEKYGSMFKEAYDLARAGNIQQAKDKLNHIIYANDRYMDPDMMILAKTLLSSLGNEGVK
jgi:hypothetical protein